MTTECDCLESGPKSRNKEFIGVDKTDGRYGDVSVLTCKDCGRKWLHYFVEYEAFRASGRWFEGLLPDDLATPLIAETAVPILDALPWYIRGGSYFEPALRGTRSSGPVPVNLSGRGGLPEAQET
jgi:hypothetical protein